jgi:hypothetical protein
MAVASKTLNATAMAVFLASAVIVECSGGMTDRNAWGRTTLLSVWGNPRPTDREASTSPGATALMPERTTSHTNADVYVASATTARLKKVMLKSSLGSPNVVKKKMRVSGVFRMRVT